MAENAKEGEKEGRKEGRKKGTKMGRRDMTSSSFLSYLDQMFVPSTHLSSPTPRLSS